MKTIEEHVWFYYGLGFSVIPLGKNETNDLKRPSLADWKRFQIKRPVKDEIKTWLSAGLFKSIGIIGGKVSGNLAIIDFDDEQIPAQIGLKLDKIVDKGHIVVKTGKGYHIYCKDKLKVSTRKVAPASMDLKAEGGYVVAPPSMHENGSQYTFINTDFKDIPIIDVKKMFDDIVNKVKEVRDLKVENNETDPPCVISMEKGTEKGRRNETLYALVNYYKHSKKLSKETIDTKVALWNRKLDEAMDNSEIDGTVDSAIDSEHQPGCTRIMELGYCPYKNKDECSFFDELQLAPILKQYGVIGKRGKILYPNLAKLIKEEHSFNFIVINDESTDKKAIFSYEDGYYHKRGRDKIRQLVSKYLGSLSSEKAKTEVIGEIKDTNESFDRSEVEPSKEYINFNNGILNIRTNKLLPHTPEFRFVQKLPINYNPKAKCPKILDFFRDVCKAKDIDVIQEMFGYTLYRSYEVNAAFILYGTGRNGKGVTLKLLRSMLGRHNIVSRKLHEITSDVFAKADLYGALANICGEMDDKVLTETANLKELTGGDIVTAQRKYFGSFQFENYAKLIFNTNRIPKTKDGSFGFYDRMRIIEFTKIYNSSNPNTDSKLFEKLNNESEMEGLIVWALEGLKRLLASNKISGDESLNEMGESYDEAVNFVFNWLKDNLQLSDREEDYIIAKDMHDIFNRECLETNKPQIPYITFTKQLFGVVRNMSGLQRRKTINGVKKTVYYRIKYSMNENETVVPDELEGIMQEIKEATPRSKKDLIKMFGKERIDKLIEDGILINVKGMWELDV